MRGNPEGVPVPMGRGRHVPILVEPSTGIPVIPVNPPRMWRL